MSKIDKTEQHMLDEIVSFFPDHEKEARELLKINLIGDRGDVRVAAMSGKYIPLTTFYENQQRAYEKRTKTNLHPIAALQQCLTHRPYQGKFKDLNTLRDPSVISIGNHPPTYCGFHVSGNKNLDYYNP